MEANLTINQSILLTCIRNGDIERAKRLVVNGLNYNFRLSEGQNLLIEAAKHSHEGWVDFLFSRMPKLDVNYSDAYHRTALMYAAENDKLFFIKELIKKGAYTDKHDCMSRTAVHIASKAGHAGAVKKLLRAGACIDYEDFAGQTPLMLAAYMGREGVLLELCRRLKRDRNSFTKLHIAKAVRHAAAGGHVRCLSLLYSFQLDRGDNLIKIDDPIPCCPISGETPLMVAALHGHEDAVKFFLKKGAEVDAGCFARRTPLMIASSEGYHSVVWDLLEAGAKVNLKGPYEKSALHFAAVGGYSGVIDLLCRNGADVFQKDSYGNTAKDMAIRHKKEDAVDTLTNFEKEKD